MVEPAKWRQNSQLPVTFTLFAGCNYFKYSIANLSSEMTQSTVGLGTLSGPIELLATQM